jgi:UDP-N-acetylglucosamine diphosphorylase/glucosamine-1-phosphate N-acetyltransferase
MSSIAAVVLAAGEGKRMGSSLPKVLHRLGGLTLIDHVLNALEPLAFERTVVVVGHRAEQVEAALSGRPVTFVLQRPQRGTGHAVMQARQALDGFSGTLAVLVGDIPLLRSATLSAFLDYHAREGAACTVLSARLDDPAAYGRIVRNRAGEVEAIVEYRDAGPREREIREINSGILAFESGPLWTHIADLSHDNAQGEYYLTDLVNIFRQKGLKVAGFCVEDDREVRGVNSPEQLRELDGILKATGGSPESR